MQTSLYVETHTPKQVQIIYAERGFETKAEKDAEGP